MCVRWFCSCCFGGRATFILLKGVNWVASFVQRKCPSIKVITQQSHTACHAPEKRLSPGRASRPQSRSQPVSQIQGPVCAVVVGINDGRLKNCVTDTPRSQVHVQDQVALAQRDCGSSVCVYMCVEWVLTLCLALLDEHKGKKRS